jgi:hypothetical protein
MNTKKALDWWFYKSPIIKKQLQQDYFPAINWQYLSSKQIQIIYEKIQKN